jgi:hypothetical protein
VRGDERGQVAGIEAVILGLLVFFVGTLVISNAWGVLDAKLAASSAAREATRAYVEAASADDALADAEAAARNAMSGHGRQPGRTEIQMLEGSFVRCARVTFQVSHPVPLIRVPFIGSAGTGFTARARHSEVVDPYRAGLPAAAACA